MILALVAIILLFFLIASVVFIIQYLCDGFYRIIFLELMNIILIF